MVIGVVVQLLVMVEYKNVHVNVINQYQCSVEICVWGRRWRLRDVPLCCVQVSKNSESTTLKGEGVSNLRFLEKFSGNNCNSQRSHSAIQGIPGFLIENVYPGFTFPSGKRLCYQSPGNFSREKSLIPELPEFLEFSKAPIPPLSRFM